MPDLPPFSYAQAFDRNIGWVTEWEQSALRGKRVAIAGMGGVGGVHLLTLVRLGIGHFNLADFDTFDIANFNRQAGATMDSIGRPKLDVMAEMAMQINPELQLGRFPAGVAPENIDMFLEGVDLFVDGFDFFALSIRRQVFARCAELGIPAVTAAPIGMGVGFLAFVPGGMSFEEYFRLEGHPENEQFLRFFMGVVPRGLHRSYLVDPSRLDLAARKGPSTGASCQLCAGVVGVAALKLLLNRGNVQPAPFHHHFDPYIGRLAITRLPQGNASPLQRMRLALVRRALAKAGRAAPASKPAAPFAVASTPVALVLEQARWSPSGDNSQPWRFEPVDQETVRVHLTTESGSNPYDYRGGEPSLLSGGMLLETMRVAASVLGRGMDWTVEGTADPYVIRVRFPLQPGIVADDLASVLSSRSVDRRPYLDRRLSEREKKALEAAASDALTVAWHESRAERWRMARLGARATDIRLRAPETFAVHQKVIDWSGKHSASGMPSRAIGLDPATLKMMRFAMQRWARMHVMNRVAGTWAAAAQLDLAPALGCAAFFTLGFKEAPSAEGRVERLLRAGQSVQRFWLRAARLGLAMQPGLAILIFSHYGADDAPFTADPALRSKARGLAASFRAVLGRGADEVVFLGRIGQPKPGMPKLRSIRRPLHELRHGGEATPTSAAAERATVTAEA